MKDLQRITVDPYPIGFCAGCGTEIMSDEPYYLDGDNMIHATGKIAYVKKDNIIIGHWTCLMQYIEENGLQDTVAAALGMERKG